MFTSIEQIKQRFGIVETELPEIKKELRKILASLHPDKNGKNEFESDLEKDEFLSAVAAIEFIESNAIKENNESTALIPVSTINALVEIMRDILPTKESEKQNPVETKLQEQITQKLTKIKSHSLYPKVTVSAITILLTTVWAFPSIIAEHPILSKYVDTTTAYFGILWFSSVVLTALIWYLSKIVETQQKAFQSRIKTDIFQNQIFIEFLWSKIDLSRLRFLIDKLLRNSFSIKDTNLDQFELGAMLDAVERKSKIYENSSEKGDVFSFISQVKLVFSKAKKVTNLYLYNDDLPDFINGIRFTKDELTNFIVASSEIKPKKIYKRADFRSKVLTDFVNSFRLALYFKPIWLIQNIATGLRNTIFGNPYEIDLELAQTLSEVFLKKVENKKIVVLQKQQLLSDLYVVNVE